MRWIKTLLACLALICVLGSFGGTVSSDAAEAYVPGTEDVPLMPELAPIPEASLAFDTASGRVVVAFLNAEADLDAVLKFYGDTLPQLGWQKRGAAEWARAGEVLSIEKIADELATVIRIELKPGS